MSSTLLFYCKLFSKMSKSGFGKLLNNCLQKQQYVRFQRTTVQCVIRQLRKSVILQCSCTDVVLQSLQNGLPWQRFTSLSTNCSVSRTTQHTLMDACRRPPHCFAWVNCVGMPSLSMWLVESSANLQVSHRMVLRRLRATQPAM
jgi:hypothetical protein